ncbi:MAG: protein kinase [Polyangiales bacterium]
MQNKKTILGVGTTTPPPAPPPSGSLKATLLGAMPSMAMVPQKPAATPAATPAEASSPPAQGSLKATLLGAMPSMAMVPQKALPTAPRAEPGSLKATLAGPSLFGADHGELAPDAVFATAFKIVRTILKGRASVLYEATLQGVGRRHALKVFRRSPGIDEQALQRFVHDARVGSRVESEHLIEVSRAGYDGASGCAWVASELLEGESLAARLAGLAEGATLPVDDAWRVLSGVCRGLAKAHQQGVVHGELRPSNVLLAKGAAEPFEVKLLDFGVVHLVPAWADATADNAWRAPELPSVEITPAADVWSVGLLAFLLFTGRDYWQGTKRDERVEHRIVPASARAEALGCGQRLPRGFDAWFAQCVSRLPASRFKSARELVPALEALQSAGRNVPVIDYTPSRGANATASAQQQQQQQQRKVTTRPSAPPPSMGAHDERPSRPSFSPPSSVPPRRAPRSPIHAPVLPEEGASRALPATTTTQNVTIPQGPLRAAALQNATPLHGTPRGSWPPSPTAGRVGMRASPPHPMSPPQGVAVPYVVTRASRPPSPPQGINTNASASGAQKALSNSGAQKALSNSGAQSALSSSGAQQALTSSGANHALSTTGAQRALADAAAQQALASPQGRAEQRTPSGRPEQRTPSGRPEQRTPPSHGSAIVSARPPPRSVPSLPPPPTPRVEATSKLAQPSRRTVLLLAAASGVVSFALVGLFVSRMQRADTPTVESTPALQAPPTEPVIAPTPTPPRAAHRWNGTFTTADSRWSFVLSLRITGNAASGWFSWTAAEVPGARVGEQVRENLEGTFDAATNSFDVHGTGSTNQALLPVNAFRLRVMPDGSLSGSTLDESERIVGTPAR